MDQSGLRKLASEANGEAWKLLSSNDLGQDEKVQMLSCAYASLYLWARAGGTTLHLARGNWLISRIGCVLEDSRLAEHHANLCRAYTELADDKKDFDAVYAIEAQARVAALNKDHAAAASLKAEASRLAALVEDSEDRQITEDDVHSEPWFGI